MTLPITATFEAMTDVEKLTKKAAKALDVENNKRSAWLKRVRLLIGHIQHRMNVDAAVAAYQAKTSPEAYAADLASREPVGCVVHPLKVQAVEAARKYASEEIERVRAKLEAANWDVNKVAPYPSRTTDQWEWQSAYRYYGFVSKLTKWRECMRMGSDRDKPLYVDMSDDGCARFTKECEANACAQYDLFICKLVSKVGEASNATLEGSHVWSHSILTVTKPNGSAERWKTQQIENVSKLGKYFPQWPTRLMK